MKKGKLKILIMNANTIIKNGCNGYLRVIEIDPLNNTVEIKTYSQWLDNWLQDENIEFSFDLR